jgi:hypothetical protein
MLGKIHITRQGYDPQLGRHIKDPYLGPNPSMGACRPDIRKRLQLGDHIFTVSGKIRDAPQFVMVGFEIAQKISANDAFHQFPERRLHRLADGQLDGNIIVNSRGKQHRLDDHPNFDRRIQNYVIGANAICISSDIEIARGRSQTIEALQEILKSRESTPIRLLTRFGRTLTERQVEALRAWMLSLKDKK